jgi:NhaA family Na+:H+ antiporter
VLIAAALLALLLANSPAAGLYQAFWHAPITFGAGSFTVTETVHFFINEGLMTVFFLVAGLEIRRELHEGALADRRLAALPIAAALGGVIAPALIYLAFNATTELSGGWAVPIATDIAFALGVLALLGRAIPRGVRVLLLALAIIDDIVAVIVVAVVFSSDFRIEGAVVAALALGAVLAFQRLGIRSAVVYVLPGVLLWYGLWRFGVHPTLAGVILGFLTPVVPLADPQRAKSFIARLQETARRLQGQPLHSDEVVSSLRRMQLEQRNLVPPVVTVQTALHPWVAYAVLPMFAFANAGVPLADTAIASDAPVSVLYGIVVGLLLGKPLGVLAAGALACRLGWCAIPRDVGWRGLALIAVLAGIGFTMAIFIANLAFTEAIVLDTAKLAVLLASCVAALIALCLGKLWFRGSQQAMPSAVVASGERS